VSFEVPVDLCYNASSILILTIDVRQMDPLGADQRRGRSRWLSVVGFITVNCSCCAPLFPDFLLSYESGGENKVALLLSEALPGCAHYLSIGISIVSSCIQA